MKISKAALFALPVLLIQSVAAQETYSYASFDYPMSSTYFTGINSQGDVVGYAFISGKGGQETQAFIRLASGAFRNLPGTSPKALAEPYGISDSETVVGFYNADAVIYKKQSFYLFTLGPRQTELIGISTNGLMVGNQFGTDVSYAFRLQNGKVQPLPTLYGYPVQANAINRAGTIAGTAFDQTGTFVTGFLLTNGASYQAIDYPGATNTYFTSINDSGVTAGYWVTDYAHGFVYSNGQFSDVDYPGAISTQAFGVNASGIVSGTYLDAGFESHGFIATPVK